MDPDGFLPFYRRNYAEIELLFQLVRAFTGRFLCNMTFLKEYMEEDIPRSYSISQKRALFFRFVEFNDPHFNDELKAKVRCCPLVVGLVSHVMRRRTNVPKKPCLQPPSGGVKHRFNVWLIDTDPATRFWV